MIYIVGFIAFTLIILLITTTIYFIEDIFSFLRDMVTISTEWLDKWLDSLPPFLRLFITIFVFALFIASICYFVLKAYFKERFYDFK